MTHTLGASTLVKLPDGRSLHAQISGDAGADIATVLLESGMGMSRSVWGLVAPALAEETRVIVYDRAGIGRSGVDSEPRTLARMAADLNHLLDELVPGPVVLVGHSWGGPIVRVAAAARPAGSVRGVLLLDQADENCDAYFEPAARRRFDAAERWLPRLAKRRVYRTMASRPGRHQPADVASDHRAEDFGPAAAQAMLTEQKVFIDELSALRRTPPDLSGVAVTVVSGTRTTRLDRRVRDAIVAAHRQTADQLGARFVSSERSAHLVMFSDPDVVVRETARLAGGAA